MCETMARLVCHASLLLTDDVRFQKPSKFSKCCPLCDLSAPDDAKHLILQCPSSEQKRREMFIDIEKVADSLGCYRLIGDNIDIPPVLLRKCSHGMSFELMESIWILAGNYIHDIYNKENLKFKRGIG